jgi:hypothetical protein
MSDLQEILKSTEESVQSVEDSDLRKIAFQEILRHRLNADHPAENKRRKGLPARSPKPQGRSGTTPKASAQSAIRPQVAALELSPDEHGLVSWSTLSVDWKKFCWMLQAARPKVDGLTNSEISYLIDKVFRESKSPEVVNNLKVQIKRGMVKSVTAKSGDREYRVWKILAGGIKEVAAAAGVAK